MNFEKNYLAAYPTNIYLFKVNIVDFVEKGVKYAQR